jgi:endoglucanase
MPRQLILAIALAAITYLSAFSTAQAQQNNSAAFAFAKRIGHGINLGNALEAPTEGAWGVVLKEEYFKAIKDAGFSHVRLPVRWSAHALQTPPYTIDSTFMERVAWAISEAQKYNLAIVVDMHDYDELQKAPEANQERFESIWKQIAERFSRASNDVAFELYNEPSNSLDSQRWNNLLTETLHVVRRTNPHRIIVIGPVLFNSIDKLPELELPEADRDLLVTVHFYEPRQFTHQGAEWIGSESNAWLGTQWLGTDAEVQAISGRFDQASGWGKQHERPLYLGEFGAYEKADMESRVRWTRTVLQQATKRGMATAYWEFCSGFGAYDPQKNCWRQPLLKALTE